MHFSNYTDNHSSEMNPDGCANAPQLPISNHQCWATARISKCSRWNRLRNERKANRNRSITIHLSDVRERDAICSLPVCFCASVKSNVKNLYRWNRTHIEYLFAAKNCCSQCMMAGCCWMAAIVPNFLFAFAKFLFFNKKYYSVISVME